MKESRPLPILGRPLEEEVMQQSVIESEAVILTWLLPRISSGDTVGSYNLAHTSRSRSALAESRTYAVHDHSIIAYAISYL
ncbi:hypothetical protein [Siphonobacter sp. SORGH_AS_1065]|uniref:hypothetical protein n=1 Tax=Siphonobacter sp. SORGH_AS_1065 TaxID=3041795 RepID=UPI002782802E|nr:hypothetical protein [Siphonobacter sp. SORGH_AS_1065]MDQ1089926.1 hypothetical protein [Siphonobacter sp. SORGH_AS_1065]